MVLYTQVMYSGTYTSTLEHYSKGRQILTGKNIVSLVAHGHIIKAIKKKNYQCQGKNLKQIGHKKPMSSSTNSTSSLHMNGEG